MKLGGAIAERDKSLQLSGSRKTTLKNLCKLDGEPDRCPEFTLIVPRVEETQVTQKGFIHTTLLEMRKESDNGCGCMLSWTTTKVNVNIVDTTNKSAFGLRPLFSSTF